MYRTMQSRFGIGLAVAVLAVAGLAMPAHAQPAVADLVAKMPAQNAADFASFGAEFVKLGPDAVKALCGMIVAPGSGDDVNARLALSGLMKYVTRPGADAERAMFATAVVEVLGAPAASDDAAKKEVKAFLIEQLQWAGRQESVAPISAYLTDERLGEPAASALRAIPVPEAVTAMMTALPASTGKVRMALVKYLGELRHQPAVPEILKDAASPDVETHRVGWFALANIGDPGARDTLAKAAQVPGVLDRAKATASYLLYAQRRAESGSVDECEAICRELLSSRTAPTEGNVQCAALSTLVGVIGERGLADLLAALDSANMGLRGTALKLAATIPGEPATQQWVAKMGAVNPEVRLEIMAMLGARGDKAALPALVAAVKDPDMNVRLAAIDAATKLGGAEAIPNVLAALQATTEAQEIAAAKAALLRMPGEPVTNAAAAALPATQPASRVALLEILAARRAQPQLEAVFTQTADADSSVRVAAIAALANLASEADLPRLIGLVLNAPDDPARATAGETVVAVAGQIEAAERRAEAVIAALQPLAGAQRGWLLALLPRLATPNAFQTVLADTKNADAAVKNTAIDALSQWPDAAAMPELLTLVRESTEPAQQDLAMRGYLRLAGSVEDKVGAYRSSLDAAKSPDQKKMVLAELGNVRSIPALELAVSFLKDDALKADAVNAAVRVACPQNEKDEGLVDAKVTPLLKAAYDATDNADIRKKIEDHIAKMPVPDEFNLAVGKPVTATVPQQGDHKPELAVDGNTETAWYGANWPCAFQVDLGQVSTIDKIHVWFFWADGRYFQYTLDVSQDGQTWATVADASANQTPGTANGVLYSFKATPARYVRASIIKNSANEAVHLNELKVYAEGAAPALPAGPQPDAEGFVSLFNGKDLTGWVGDTQGYVVEDGTIACKPGGNLYTEKPYGDCDFRFEFKLTPGANNGLAFHCPIGGWAYDGMELQILDNTADQYKTLEPYQYHGSIYGIAPAKREFLKPVGEWNQQEVIAKGRQITVILNGETIVDVNLDEAVKDGPMDHKEHKNLDLKEGHIGFLGHGSVLWFRNIKIKELK